MSYRAVTLVGAALLVLLSACATPVSDSETLRPFEEIAIMGPDVDVDLSGLSATVAVATSIDAVCAVSYGIDEPVGSLATDRDMAAGGHREHRVLITGLEPESTYSYRLQGVGTDGRLYRSEVFTFSTPSAPSSSFGENLAIGAEVVDVSSEFSAAFAASGALDGDLATEWSSRGDGDDAYITVDLGKPLDVVAVAFRTRQMADGTAITATFKLVVDGELTFGPFPAGSQPAPVEFVGQIVRFEVDRSTGGNTGASEVEVYGSP